MKQEELIMKKRMLGLLLTAALVLGVTGCGNTTEKKTTEQADGSSEELTTEAGETQTVRLGVWTGGIDHYLAVVGTEQGIFQKHGIDLETTEFASGINTIDAIVTGQLDIGMIADFAGVNRIGNTQDNFDAKIIGRYVTATSWGLYVNEDEVKDLSDLAGKGFGTIPGTITDYYAALTYEKAGIAEDEQKLVNIDSTQAMLGVVDSGEVVAGWSSGASAKKLEEHGMKEFLTMEDLGISVDAYYVASKDILAEHEDLVEDFLAAIKETEEWITANPEEAAGIVEDKIGIPKDQAAANIEASTLLLDFKQDSVDHLDGIKKWAVGAGMFEKDYDVKNYVDTTALGKLFPDAVEN